MSDASHTPTPASSPAPPSVYLLAEHLDAALAAGEDLAKVRYVWFGPLPREADEIAEIRAGQREAIEKIRTLELALLSRILKAREWATVLAGLDENFSAVARLYVSATATLVDAVEEYADFTAVDFDTGKNLTAYVRSRGLIAEEAPALTDSTPVAANDAFLVARRVPLGVLLDLVSTFLDALEGQFDLFVENDSEGAPAFIPPAAAPAH